MEAKNHGQVTAGVPMVPEANSLEMPLLKVNNGLERRDIRDSEPPSWIKCSQKCFEHSISLS